MNKKIFIRALAWVALVAFLAVSVITVVPFSANAEKSAQEKLDEARKEQQKLNKQLNSNKEKQKAEKERKSVLDGQISDIQAEINSLDAEIEEINNRIEQKDAELAEAHRESSNQYASYKDRVKIIVEKGPITYIEVLANANSLEDFFVRMDVVEQIAAYDNEVLKELKANEERIELLKEMIEQERANVTAVMETSLAKKRDLAAKKQASQAILNELAESEQEITAELKAAKKAEQEASAEIARLVSGDTSKYIGGQLLWPSTSSYTITSPFSMRVHPTLGVYKQHTGIDIGASYGTSVLAAGEGTVIISGWNNAWGNYVVINHGGGITTLYAHNSQLLVSKGARVTRGQTIAKVGSTGYSTGPHIHFEVQVNGKAVNPMSYLQ